LKYDNENNDTKKGWIYMKKVIVIGIITVLIITLYIGCFAAFAEKKYGGNKIKLQMKSQHQFKIFI